MSLTPNEKRQALRHFARPRDGIFSLEEARALGVTDRMLHRMRDRGEIERVHPRTYRFTALPWTWQAKLRAATTAVNAAASHRSAARLLGLEGVAQAPPEVSVAWPAKPHLSGVTVHSSRDLEKDDLVEVKGIPTTTGSRALVDLAGVLPPTRLIPLVDEAICAGVARRARLHERALALRNGRSGVDTIIEVTEEGAEGRFWSALERTFGEGIASCNIPLPVFNAPVRVRGELLYADALWEAERVVVELQSLRFHSTPPQRQRDAEKVNRYTLLGLRPLTFTWRDVFEDFARVATEIRAALAAA